MKAVTLALAATLIGSTAFAQTTIIREKPAEETTVIKRDTMDGTVVKKKVETTGSVGCETKSVTKTNDMGDKVTKTKTDC
ncbi:hypothetical protein [Enterovirga aerilata]|uniref:Uncharacterized protein n=1 Tax=Enterovirga aerilata TaxID=2730920 RepID=A0A849I397_9HYPH|nr:hypothetical protein [Enterovirga sp. DB1703]NNM72114.1 hypothetical protein [Enterovirga sp. DB1703]